MKITFIQTGGTIDKDYPLKTRGRGFLIGEPAVHRILAKLNPSFDFEVITAFRKDSLDITDEDRATLSDLINSLESTKIIITHGTDTMMETASFINERVKDKLIVVTGSMRPEKFSNSDAPVNIGCAIATANLIDKGVYIAMHGIVKPFNEIRRNMDTGKYY